MSDINYFGMSAKELALLSSTGFGAMQKTLEFEKLLELVAKNEPPENSYSSDDCEINFLEIGFGNGGSAWAWSKFLYLDNLICVDLPKGPWGGSDSTASFNYIKENSVKAECFYVDGESYDLTTFTRVEGILQKRKLDFLFIDGNHSYEGVRKDYEMYSPLVRKGGLIAFHDICIHDPKSGCEVAKFWKEVAGARDPSERIEFISLPTNWGGIGVLRKLK